MCGKEGKGSLDVFFIGGFFNVVVDVVVVDLSFAVVFFWCVCVCVCVCVMPATVLLSLQH